MIRRWLAPLCLLATFSGFAPTLSAEVVHTERSLYRNMLVRERDGQRCLIFTVRRSDRNQSCMDLEDPMRLIFPYARMMFAGLLIEDDPKRILMVGLGGATLPRVYAELYPEAEQDLVEIDQAVVRVAREYFDFEPTERMNVVVRDARVFVKRALAAGEKYDYVMLDAFTGDYIPEHLLTQEFLEEVQGILAPGGVLVANTFSSSRLYHHESATYDAVFEHVAELRLPITLNRILVAYDGPWPDEDELLRRADALAPSLDRFRIEPRALARALNTDFRYDESARVLTDQYAPANLLSQ